MLHEHSVIQRELQSRMRFTAFYHEYHFFGTSFKGNKTCNLQFTILTSLHQVRFCDIKLIQESRPPSPPSICRVFDPPRLDLCVHRGSGGKNLPASTGDTRDTGSIPGSGRSPGVGNGHPLQCSCLGNSMGRGAWRVTVHAAVAQSSVVSNSL